MGNSFGKLHSSDETFAVASPQLIFFLLQLAAVITAGLLLLYILLCYEDFHFHVAHVYACLGYPHAQHILGQRYLQGNISPTYG